MAGITVMRITKASIGTPVASAKPRDLVVGSRERDPDNEQFFPGQPRQLFDLLPGEKEIIEFTQAQGANFHCQPTGRQLTHTRMLDWLADHLPPSAGKVSELLLASDRSGWASGSSA